MIFGKYTINEIAAVLEKVVNKVTMTMIGAGSRLADAPDDYIVGQRFYVDTCQPLRCTFFIELSIEAKKKIVEGVFGEKWSSLKNIQIDDCLLEFTGIIAGRAIAELTGGKELIKTGFPMVVFDEYEDNLEVTGAEDFYRIDFRMEDAPFSVLLCASCTVR